MTTDASQYITVAIAASDSYLGLSAGRVRQMCDLGVFKTAHKPGHGLKAKWRILRAEVIAHKYKGHIANYEPTKSPKSTTANRFGSSSANHTRS